MKLKTNEFDYQFGFKQRPYVLEMGPKKNPLQAAKDIGLALRKFTVGDYNTLRKAAAGSELDAHHLGQGKLMSKFIPNYDYDIAPAIPIPPEGHRFSIPGIGRLSTSTKGFANERQVLARDIRELRRVYPGIPTPI